MQKLLINVSDELIEHIDKAIQKWGFGSRSEFFRFAIIDFIRNDGRFMPADDVMKKHTKAILSVKARQNIPKRGITA